MGELSNSATSNHTTPPPAPTTRAGGFYWADPPTPRLLPADESVMRAPMKKVPKQSTDDALIQEFLNKGGKISVGKTKPAPAELGLSNNTWGNKLTREEKAARDKKLD